MAANREDYAEAEARGMDAAMLDRLLLTMERLNSIAKDVRSIAQLPNPVGETIKSMTLGKRPAAGKTPGPAGRDCQHLRESAPT